MVLDAMAGFYGTKSPEFCLIKSGCTIMLEGLMHVKPDVTVELRDKALKVAVQWNQKWVNSFGKAKKRNAFGFLLLVGVYGLIDGFSIDEFIDCFVNVGGRRQTFELCRMMIPADKINNLIQELINKDMQIAAVKFSIELQKTDEFSPAHLLEERKLMSMRIVEEMHKNGIVCQNEVIRKEIDPLWAMIKCIDEYGLESEYPKDNVVDLVKKLENEVGCRKRLAKVAVHKKQKISKPKKQKLNSSHNTFKPHSHAADDVGQNYSPPAGCTPTAP